MGDADVLKCIRMLTFLPLEQIDEMDTWEGSQLNEAKEILAFELTKLVHGEEEAEKAEDAAKALFVGGGDDANMPTTEIYRGSADGRQDRHSEPDGGLRTGALQRARPGGWCSRAACLVNDEKVANVDVRASPEEMLKRGREAPQGQEGLPQGNFEVEIVAAAGSPARRSPAAAGALPGFPGGCCPAGRRHWPQS